jgi:tetratricopeptide (TPR) repeat protein
MSNSESPAIPHYAKGAEEFRKENYEKAVEHFREAVAVDNNFFRSYAYLGMSLDKLGKIDEAIDAYRACIEIAPEYHKAYNNVGELYRRKGLLDYATMVFKMATEIAPELGPYFYNLGLTYMDIGMKTQAEEAFRRAHELEPDNFETASDLAQLLFTNENLRGSLDVLTNFLSRAPDHDRAPEIRARITMLKRNMGDTDKREDPDQTQPIPGAES